MSGHLRTPGPLVGSPWYPLNRWLVGTLSPSGHFAEEKIIASVGIEPRFLGFPAVRVVSIMTALSRLFTCSTKSLVANYRNTKAREDDDKKKTRPRPMSHAVIIILVII